MLVDGTLSLNDGAFQCKMLFSTRIAVTSTIASMLCLIVQFVASCEKKKKSPGGTSFQPKTGDDDDDDDWHLGKRYPRSPAPRRDCDRWKCPCWAFRPNLPMMVTVRISTNKTILECLMISSRRDTAGAAGHPSRRRTLGDRWQPSGHPRHHLAPRATPRVDGLLLGHHAVAPPATYRTPPPTTRGVRDIRRRNTNSGAKQFQTAAGTGRFNFWCVEISAFAEALRNDGGERINSRRPDNADGVACIGSRTD